MKGKLKLAVEHLTTCAGCENAILDLGDSLLTVLGDLELVYAPILMDASPPDRVDIAIVTGAVRTEEDKEKVRNWREKSSILIAFGSCACFGGIPGLANLLKSIELLKTSYLEQLGTENPEGEPPHVEVPELTSLIKPVSEYVKVDYMLPGCPPPSNLISELFTALIKGEKFTLPEKSVCDDCPLNSGDEKVIKCIKRWGFDKVDVDRCFLEQGFICLGPATRGGCGARCIKAGYPCRGCMGVLEGVEDQAAKMISAIASATSLDEVTLEDLKKILDLVGTLYRFTFPSSIFGRRVRRDERE